MKMKTLTTHWRNKRVGPQNTFEMPPKRFHGLGSRKNHHQLKVRVLKLALPNLVVFMISTFLAGWNYNGFWKPHVRTIITSLRNFPWVKMGVLKLALPILVVFMISTFLASWNYNGFWKHQISCLLVVFYLWNCFSN